MRAFQQRLKELERESFEHFCFDLIKERHPGLNIRHVDGMSGDQGIDLFEGDLDGRPVIWQCKHFPNGVRDSQKKQIKASLNQALKNFHPKEWILCIPIDLDVKAHRWLQRLAHSKARDGITVKLMQGSDILHELIHRKSLRNQYFPAAALETGELRALLRKTDELTLEELESLTVDNVEQYIDRLKERDARFNYEIRFSKDSTPTLRHPAPGLIASVSSGQRTIDVFARDVDAIDRNPPSGTLTLSSTGAAKLLELQKTGRPQHLSADECLNFSSDFSFLLPTSDYGGLELHVGPTRPQHSAELNLRLTFEASSDVIVYDWIPFEVTRVGTDEMEIVSRGNFPFTITVILPQDIKATTGFNLHFSH
jgi:hypothetical protein